MKGRSAARQTEPERKACKTKATGNWGGEAGRGPYLMVAGLQFREVQVPSAFSSALRSSAAERRRACVCVGAGEVTAALGPRARADVFVRGRTGAGKANGKVNLIPD